AQAVGLRIDPVRLQLDLVHGRRFLGPLEQLDRMTRHDRRDGMLVDQLRVAIASQQHAEIIEPRDHALQLHPVYQEDGEGSLVLADLVEEGVMQVLCAFGRHCRCSVFRSQAPSRETYCRVARALFFQVLLHETPTAPLQGTFANGASISWWQTLVWMSLSAV